MSTATIERADRQEQRVEGEHLEEKVLRSLPVRIARWVSGVVGFVATLLGVVFVLFPGAKPEGPEATTRATLSKPTPEILSYGQYLDRVDQRRGSYDARALRRRGIFVEFDWSVEGYRGKVLPLRWQLIDARGEQLAKSRDISLIPEAKHDAATWNVWVPLPHRRRRGMAVQLQIYEESGRVPIARARTQPLVIRA